MIAQLANGGFKIKPRIIDDGTVIFENIKSNIENTLRRYELELNQKDVGLSEDDMNLVNNDSLNLIKPLFRNPENVKFVNEAMYSVINEPFGTAYKSRYEEKKYQYAGKTGTSQVKKITEEQREAKRKIEDIPYKERDHSVFIAFAPYENPRYAISVLIEHGGSGSLEAAPLAKKIIKLVIDRHELREKIRKERKRDI